MDEEGSQAKTRILENYTNVVASFDGEEAWKNVLEIRYQPGAPRARVKRMYRDYTKSGSLLVVFLMGDPPVETQDIGIHFYLNRLDGPADEGEDNMFQVVPYTSLEFPRCPKWLKRVFQDL